MRKKKHDFYNIIGMRFSLNSCYRLVDLSFAAGKFSCNKRNYHTIKIAILFILLSFLADARFKNYVCKWKRKECKGCNCKMLDGPAIWSILAILWELHRFYTPIFPLDNKEARHRGSTICRKDDKKIKRSSSSGKRRHKYTYKPNYYSFSFQLQKE